MRAIAILLVIGFHSRVAMGNDGEYSGYLGVLGVWVFFVISGLLITWLMIREREATGEFSLGNFYLRRFFRIIPVYWLLLATVTALNLAHVLSITRLDILRALTFTHNYPLFFHHPQEYTWWLEHTWSLSIEEQFYLIWPILFALLPRKSSARIAVILAFSGPALRLFYRHFLPALPGYEGIEFFVDILAAGCASAFLLDSSEWRGRMRKLPVWPTLTATSSFLIVANPFLWFHFVLHSHPNAMVRSLFLFVPTIESVAIAVTLLVLIEGTPGLAFRLLNSWLARHIGKLSYSLYIWQELFLGPGRAANLSSLAWRLAAIYLVALCSFNLIERPFVRLRSRMRRGIAV